MTTADLRLLRFLRPNTDASGSLRESIGAIHTRVLKRPLVIEKERINFD